MEILKDKKKLKRKMNLINLLIIVISIHVSASLPDYGPYTVKHKTYVLNFMDETDKNVDIYSPVMESKKFPFIVYSHGAYGGGDIDYAAYIPLLESVASYGFIVAAPRSCSVGCSWKNCKTLENDP